jgi:hypothetical protein
MRSVPLGPLLALILVGCAARNAIWIEKDSTARRLVFRVAQNREATAPPSFFYGLSVTTCSGNRVMWIFGGASNATPAPTRIVYGQPSAGYTTREGPRPLGPGCYEAVISGAASVRFVIDEKGMLAEQPESGER